MKHVWKGDDTMKKIVAVGALAALLVLVGCTSVIPVGATSNPVGSKVGESSATFLFGGPAFGFPLGGGDVSIQTAAQNGGISSISTVDQKIENYYIMTKVTTIVTGN